MDIKSVSSQILSLPLIFVLILSSCSRFSHFSVKFSILINFYKIEVSIFGDIRELLDVSRKSMQFLSCYSVFPCLLGAISFFFVRHRMIALALVSRKKRTVCPKTRQCAQEGTPVQQDVSFPLKVLFRGMFYSNFRFFFVILTGSFISLQKWNFIIQKVKKKSFLCKFAPLYHLFSPNS